MDKKIKAKEIKELINEKFTDLNFSEEDKILIEELVNSYYRKRIGLFNSESNTMAAAFLWVYSKSNFLWESDKRWSKQKLTELFHANSQTVGNLASKLSKILDIRLWDERFCRKNVAESNPFNDFIMLESGFIAPKNIFDLTSSLEKQTKTKEDYLEMAFDFVDKGEKDNAIEYFKKALTFDENYLEAINGIASIYFYKDIEKSKEYYRKAYEISKTHFKGIWPDTLEWGILENRGYLRAIQGLALVLWREHEIEEAKKLFSLILKLNPSDNQGIRYCMAAIYKGMNWGEFGKLEDSCAEKGDYNMMNHLVKEQNEVYKFWIK